MQAILLVKTDKSHVILCNAFHIQKLSAAGSTPTGWIPLDLTVAEIALCPNFLLQTPQKNYKLHDILAYFKAN
jgi:hypothetical protein